MTGLTNGTSYTFTVTAHNVAGDGAASAPSAAVTAADRARARRPPWPATAGNAQATVSFTAPASNGGAAITSYTVTSSPGGEDRDRRGQPDRRDRADERHELHVHGHGTQRVGDGAASAASNAVVPGTTPVAPGAPTGVAATPGNGQASVTFTPPASDGGAAITSYTVTPRPGGQTATGTAGPIMVTGLTNGTSYTFTVTATTAPERGPPPRRPPRSCLSRWTPAVAAEPARRAAALAGPDAAAAFEPPRSASSPVGGRPAKTAQATRRRAGVAARAPCANSNGVALVRDRIVGIDDAAVTGFLSRRDFLQLLAATAVLPVSEAGAAPRRRSVGIVGGGMAGVSLAWLLDGPYDVTLLEARESIGGNVRSFDVALDGHEFVVDMGAQYFHPGPYPVYTALLGQLGLFDANAVEQSAAHGFPASITLTAGVNATPRFVSPILPDRWWPLLASWNWAGLWAFGGGFLAAKAREDLNESWDVTLEQWLPTLGLPRELWEGMLLPWAASLFSGDVEQCRGLSARAAMVFAAKALPPNPLDPLSYYVLKPGLIAALRRMIDQCSTLTVLTDAAVSDVKRTAQGYRPRCADGGPSSSTGSCAHRRGLRRVSPPGHFPRRRRSAAPSTAWSSTTRGSSSTPIPCTHPATSMVARSSTATSTTRSARRRCGWRPCSRVHLPRPRPRSGRAGPHIARSRHRCSTTPSSGTCSPRRPRCTPRTASNPLQGRDGIWFAGGYLYPYTRRKPLSVPPYASRWASGAVSARSQMLSAAANGAVR